MKILAIDYGRKWIGLAISDDPPPFFKGWGGRLAFPYKTLENSPGVFSVLNEIVKKEDVYKIVIGLPLNKQMKPTQQTTETENWASELIKKVEVPIDFENEIFTSKAADKLGTKNQHSAAAAIFLQSYLDRQNK